MEDRFGGPPFSLKLESSKQFNLPFRQKPD